MFFRRKKPLAPPESKGPAAPAPAGGPAPQATPGPLPASPPEAAPAPGPSGPAPRSPGAPSTQFLTGDQATDRRTVQVLLEAIARVSNAPVSTPEDLEALLVKIVDLSVEVTDAERGLLIIEDRSESASRGALALEVHVARSRRGEHLPDDLRFSTSIARRVLEQGEPVRATVQSDSEALELGRSVFDLKLRAVMCVPLGQTEPAAPSEPAWRGSERSATAARAIRGVLYVDSRAATREFNQRDLSLFAALASQIAASMQKAQLHLDSLEKVRLEQSLELASSIQRDLMPNVPYTLPGFEVHGWYRPAERTAGDFYDFVRGKGGVLGVVVGDVTGHGIGPALITASAQAGLRSYLRMLADPGEVFTLLNQDLSERMEEGRFLTLFLALIQPDGKLCTLNAGHPAGLLWRAASGQVETLPRHGPALGMFADETYRTDHAGYLAPGDALLAFSDGATEARAPDRPEGFLGEEGLAAEFRAALAAGCDARATALRLAERISAHGGKSAEDDITLVVVRRTPA
jgi:serine phosphatase RsbU (regulator of sigma subunit)